MMMIMLADDSYRRSSVLSFLKVVVAARGMTDGGGSDFR
jgi:hypothetical protein